MSQPVREKVRSVVPNILYGLSFRFLSPVMVARSLQLIRRRKKLERRRRSDRPPPYSKMESKGADELPNPGDAPEKDQTQTPTHDQDQEGDAERKKAEADDDGTVDLLLIEIQALRDEKRALLLHFYNACKELHRSEADNRSLRAKVQGLKEKVKSTEAREEELQQPVKAIEETNTRLEMELAGFQSQIDRHLEIQGEHDAAVEATARRLEVWWGVVVVASAVAVAVYLRKAKQRESGARDL